MRHLGLIGLIVGIAVFEPVHTVALPQIGSNCTLGKRVALAMTRSVAGEVDQAIRTKNNAGIDALIAEGKVTLVTDGPVAARIVSVSSTWGTIKVRVLAGSLRGTEGWLIDGMCDPA